MASQPTGTAYMLTTRKLFLVHWSAVVQNANLVFLYSYDNRKVLLKTDGD